MFSQWKAVVTGASSGIGKAIALALAAQGATLFLIGRKRVALDRTAKSARATAAKVLTCQTDLTEDENIREIVARLRREFTSIDLLVHAAGMISIGLVENAPIEDLDRQYRVNVRVPFHLTQALLPMVKTTRGQIVFLNSLVGLDAKAGSSQYSATKHALKALADSLRQEVNADGVRVLSVFLGRSATPMQAQLQQMEGSVCRPRLLIQPNDVASVVMNAVSLSRTAEITDITIRHAIKTA
jgi:short-subunit dehydrogenase